MANRWWHSRMQCLSRRSTRSAATKRAERQWRHKDGHDIATASSHAWLASGLYDAVPANMGRSRDGLALGRGRLWGLDEWPASEGGLDGCLLSARVLILGTTRQFEYRGRPNGIAARRSAAWPPVFSRWRRRSQVPLPFPGQGMSCWSEAGHMAPRARRYTCI